MIEGKYQKRGIKRVVALQKKIIYKCYITKWSNERRDHILSLEWRVLSFPPSRPILRISFHLDDAHDGAAVRITRLRVRVDGVI